jgi:hypothetical protein
MNTYCGGYKILFKNDITKNDMVILCNKLNEKFNEHYHTTKFVFEPEPISEGGIVWRSWPNKHPDMYKSMRFTYGNIPEWKWASVSKNVMTEWINNEDIVFKALYGITDCYNVPVRKTTKKYTPMNTFLKAFENAPSWTITELEIFAECFGEIGVEVIGKYPPKKDLIKN